MKIELPVCQWRGDQVQGNEHICTSRRLFSAAVIDCSICKSPDHKPPPEGPSLLKQVFNYSKAVVDHAIGGLATVTEEEHNRRVKICQRCEFFDRGTCNHTQCGCNIIVKAQWAEQRCPLNPPKWEAAI